MNRGKKEPDSNPMTSSTSEADWVAKGWADESDPLTVASSLEMTISIRLDPESAALIRRAARLSGLTKLEFVRRSAVQAAARMVELDRLHEKRP